MSKLLLLFSFIAVACASHLQTGYNYENTAPINLESIHQVYQPALTSYSHDDGVQKQFYHFNAPEEHVQQHKVVTQIPVQTHPKNNLQVIFIKPSEQKIHKKPVQHLTQNVVEQKTHIYVLSKEQNHATIPKHTQVIQQSTVHHHKPDVHFLKYRTAEDAHNIQQSIIQQYGGKPSEIIHSGSGASVAFGSTGNIDHHVSQEYLPPKLEAPSVDNSYAKNFLPSGADVVPGSSYLPPLLRH